MYVNTQIVLIFSSCPVHVSFPINNSLWIINVVNSTSCILLKQQYKGIILLVIVFRCEFTPKSFTKTNILQGVCNWRNWVEKLIIESLSYILIALMQFWNFWEHYSRLEKMFNYQKTSWWVIWHQFSSACQYYYWIVVLNITITRHNV